MIAESLNTTRLLNVEFSSMSSDPKIGDVHDLLGESNDDDVKAVPAQSNSIADDDLSEDVSADVSKPACEVDENIVKSEEKSTGDIDDSPKPKTDNVDKTEAKPPVGPDKSKDRVDEGINSNNEENMTSDDAGDYCAEEKEIQSESERDNPTDDSVSFRDIRKDNTESVIVRKINTGRWSAKEHEAFLEGLEKYGKEWKRVAGNVGTRSVMQTRTHAQKHFDRLKPGGGAGGIWGKDKPSSISRTADVTTGGIAGMRIPAAKADVGSTGGGNEGESGTMDKHESAMSRHRSDLEKRRADELSQDFYGEYPHYAKRGYHPPQAGYSITPPLYSNVRLNSSTPTPSGTNAHLFVGGPMPADRSMSPHPDPYGLVFPSSEYYKPHGSGSSDARVVRSASPFTDRDILLPITIQTIKSVSNREYIDVLRANCCIYHSLPSPEQAFFIRNICNFLQVVRGRRWFISHQQWGTPMPLVDPGALVAAELRQDSLKYAALQFHPYWLLGDHDPSNRNRNDPFAYRRSDGTWIPIDKTEAREVLRNEGPKSLLVLPPSIEMKDSSSNLNSGV